MEDPLVSFCSDFQINTFLKKERILLLLGLLSLLYLYPQQRAAILPVFSPCYVLIGTIFSLLCLVSSSRRANVAKTVLSRMCADLNGLERSLIPECCVEPPNETPDSYRILDESHNSFIQWIAL